MKLKELVKERIIQCACAFRYEGAWLFIMREKLDGQRLKQEAMGDAIKEQLKKSISGFFVPKWMFSHHFGIKSAL